MPTPIWDLTALMAPRDCLGCGAAEAGPLCGPCLTEPVSALGPGCSRCGGPETPTARGGCPWCRALKRPPQCAAGLYRYQGLGRTLFHLIKYGGYGGLIAPLVARETGALLERLCLDAYDCLVPIPQGFARKLGRFFNPAEEVARVLGRMTGIPVCRALATGPFHRRQVGLHRAARRTAVRGKFRARMRVPPRVVLVDDVVTTGATLESAQACVCAAGAREVAWVTLFRTV